MKRFIVLLFASCLCTLANAQIQTKFWGLELSGSYTLPEAGNIISAKCEDMKISRTENEIFAYNGMFGGYMWDIVSFSFYDNGISNNLSRVVFFSSHSSYDSAETRYKALLKRLEEKYGHSTMSRDKCHWWDTSAENNMCNLSLSQSEYGGGWMVGLVYLNELLWLLLDQQEAEEL